MTLKEQRFEDFVDNIQAKHDELSEIIEWRRLKNHEEEAICVYHEVGENLDMFSARMKTHDQQEMEYHCQRKKQKDKNLDLVEASRLSYARAQEYTGAREAEERARNQERMRSNAVATFKAGVQASSDPVTIAKILTNTTQQASQQSEHKKSKPEKHGNTSHPVSSLGTGTSRQQEQKTKLSKEEICRQFLDQVRALPATTNRTKMPLTTANVEPVPPAIAALAREARPKELNVAVPAAREDSFKAELAGYQPRMGIKNGMNCPKRSIPIKKKPVLKKVDLGCSSGVEQSLPRNNGPGSDASQAHQVAGSRERPSTNPIAQQDSSEGSRLPETSMEEQNVTHNIDQEQPVAESSKQPATNPFRQQASSEGSRPSETSMEEQNVTHNIDQEHPVAESLEQPATDQSSQQNTGKEPLPACSVPSSPLETPIVSPPNTHEMWARNLTNDDQNNGLDNGRRLLELEWDIYGKVMSTSLWDRMTPARRTDPFINSLIAEHLERWKGRRIYVGEED